MQAADPATVLARFRYATSANRVLLAAERFRRVLKAGFRPDEPRVPAGSPDGGQWTDEGGGGASAGIEQDVDPIVTGATEDEDPTRYSVDLREEEAPAGIGHTISKHVGKSDGELLYAMERNTYRGWLFSFIDYREGSFRSVEIANDLTNRVLERNKPIVDLVASGRKDEAFLKERFGYVTGREARRASPDAEPYLRDTYGVGVLIRHDPQSAQGYRVVTAYPRND